MEKFKAGDIVTLKVLRKIETGYILTNGVEEVFLHEKEFDRALEVEDSVEVFLYHDKKEELVSSAKLPTVRSDVFDWAEVVEVKPGLGVFVDIGIRRNVLVSEDSLSSFRTVWPEVGDQLYVILANDKKERLLAEPVTEADFEDNWDAAPTSLHNNTIGGRVFRSGREGAVIITDEGYRGFIHHSERKREPRVGEWVEGRVIKVKPDGTLNVSLLPRKQEAQQIDAEQILAYLVVHDGVLPFDNKADPEIIKATFQISKAAFKRAIGLLLKEEKIEQKDNKTYLLED